MNNKFLARYALISRGIVIFLGLIALWWGGTWLFSLPSYMLPTPPKVVEALWNGRSYLWKHTLITMVEICLGLFFGLLFGVLFALAMMFSPILQRWLMPVLVISQAIPVFALAPLLVLWLGFGLWSKVVATTLVIFFPITASFFDGLRRTETGWLELAQTMGASPYSQLRHVRLIAALPAFGSGLRVAAVIAPIGAIIGEWVGAAGGLGYVMLNANARTQTAVCFAALFILSIMAVVLWQLVDVFLKHVLYWVPDSERKNQLPESNRS
ncbi:ABC transporter permease [Prodigiosinella confusarubida]|uniref:ABC transporter permease n=1 Tax=Serratia sp. (strain ATCC 39006) TaxID=104623 RepID=A0A2I5TFL2_SERS3|nr:ABC transporter permease [Serratia sp. ATCC 39006]AUG99031.1 ABC transporter permease [Serratia sp. ATCC 39006]AUH03346.1 ABC transporter permease [Serratia sp. ATCC 39006]